MYQSIFWQDHVVDAQGKVIQAGTDMSAVHFNTMDFGIFNNDLTTRLLTLNHKNYMATVDSELIGEVIETTLTNNQRYPFNNSLKSISLKSNKDTVNYTVNVDVISSDGSVGDIKISEKKLNGFKISYDGSAKNVVLRLKITGGIML